MGEQTEMICLSCGDRFEGEDVLCEKCKARRFERAKTNKHLKSRSIFSNFIDALGVIIALILM